MDIHRCGRPCHNEGAAPARRPGFANVCKLAHEEKHARDQAALIEPVVDVVGISWGAGLPRSRTLTNGARVIQLVLHERALQPSHHFGTADRPGVAFVAKPPAYSKRPRLPTI
jgi:hypothetical protein